MGMAFYTSTIITSASSGSGSLREPPRDQSHNDTQRQVDEEDRKGSVGCESLWIDERNKVSLVLLFSLLPILIDLDPSIHRNRRSNAKRTNGQNNRNQQDK
jgi:hypothetical protein